MLVVDASCLYDLVTRAPLAGRIQERLESDPDLAAPHVIDVEVLSTIRRDYLRGLLDGTAAILAIDDLRDWPGARIGHQVLLRRAWQLRDNVRGWDAFYVALAEAVGATLLTRDQRLARVPVLHCPVEVVGESHSNGA